MSVDKLFSLIIPLYNQANSIENDILELGKVLQTHKIPYEIIIVDDGSTDGTHKKTKTFKKNKKITIYRYKRNRGKGYAVKYGINRAKGVIVGFKDAGSDIDKESVINLLKIMNKNNADIVVGSKIHKNSKIKYPIARKIMSWGFRSMNKILFGFLVEDTQVGLKIFSRESVHKIFKKVKTHGYAFDVEVLAIASSLGYKKIYEAPVKVTLTNENSIASKNIFLVVSSMLWDTLIIFYKFKRGKYK
jgi:glycosyltransferase involved in cell wall biosynthesis